MSFPEKKKKNENKNGDLRGACTWVGTPKVEPPFADVLGNAAWSAGLPRGLVTRCDRRGGHVAAWRSRPAGAGRRLADTREGVWGRRGESGREERSAPHRAPPCSRNLPAVQAQGRVLFAEPPTPVRSGTAQARLGARGPS